MEITGQQVWEALLNDPRPMAIDFEEQKVVLRQYIENDFLKAISETLNSVVSYENITKTIHAFLEDIIANSFFERIIFAAPKEAVSLQNKMIHIADLLDEYEGLINAMGDVIKDIPGFFLKHETNEYLELKNFGLSEENFLKATNGQLTISQLLLSQPALIIPVFDE